MACSFIESSMTFVPVSVCVLLFFLCVVFAMQIWLDCFSIFLP